MPIDRMECRERPPTVKCSVWLMPRHDGAAHLRHLIESLSARFGAPAFAPHLTLIGDVLQPAELVAASLARFQSSLRVVVPAEGAGHSAKRFESLFVRLQPVPKLLQLRKEVASALGVEVPTGFRPHVSLMYPVNEVQERDRRALCSEVVASIPTHLEFDRLSVVEPMGPNGWEDVTMWRVVGA